VSETTVEHTTEPLEVPPVSGLTKPDLVTRYLKLAGIALLVLALVLYPLLVPSSKWVDVANRTLIYSVGAIALNVLIGVAGQFSLGSAAFMAIGSFTAATVSVQVWDLPMIVALPLGAVVGGIAAIILGVLALRIRGFYLALATIALHYIVLFGVQRYQVDTVGITGFLMPTPSLFGWEIVSARQWYCVLLVVLVIIAAGVHNVLRSRTGRAFRAVKDRDVAAAILGVDVTRTKLTAFIITSMVIGFQGSLYAYYLGVVTYESFNLDLSVMFIAMIMIGGVASIAGSILGAIFVTGLPFLVEAVAPNLPSWFPFVHAIESNLFAVESIIYGLAIIIFILKYPRGMAYGFRRLGKLIERQLVRRVAAGPPTGAGGTSA
jgi:branched-chain amino acid transport system permease protein